MSQQPSFAEFYAAVHDGMAPFPWQLRLAQQILEHGWPKLLDLPTGSGKTTALEIALYGLACAPARLPRRTVLVVDRRIVVDQAATAARDLQRRLATATTGPMRWVADALRKTWDASAGATPFAVAVMRGGMPRDNDWAKRPDQPLIGLATVDQFGSRLLFRGYGVGNRSVSIHAGLLGNDTLLLLDEVHLSQPFAETLAYVERTAHAESSALPHRFQVVHMTATPRKDAPANMAFALEHPDLNHPVLGPRLRAAKSAHLLLVEVTGKDELKKKWIMAQRVASEALRLQQQGQPVVGVVVNRVDTARLVMRSLRTQAQPADCVLVTGRMRPIDRDHVVEAKLLPRAGAGRSRASAHPLIVVATQCIEAGADLDFDALVTECASIDALRQRFGRVDRRGERGQSSSCIVARSDDVAADAEDAVYGPALANTWRWLESTAIAGKVDFGVQAQRSVHPDMTLFSPSRNAPVLMPVHLDLWTQTTPRPAHDPDVALWLHGPKTQPADVQVVWRAGVEAKAASEAAVLENLMVCRPSALEAMSLPLRAVIRWLRGDSGGTVADVLAQAESDDDEPKRARNDEPAVPVAVRWDGEDSKLVTADEIRPGDVIVVDAAKGGITDGSFDPEGTAHVLDLGDLAQLRGRGVASLRIGRQELELWQLSECPLPALGDPEEEPDETKERVLLWLDSLPKETTGATLFRREEWTELLRSLRSPRTRVDVVQGQFLLRTRLRRDGAWQPEFADSLTEDDDSSFREAQVTLSAHSQGVRELVEQYATSLGFPHAITEDLALAGWLHDIGKADPRFQRWLVGGSEVRLALLEEPIAKSSLASDDPTRRRMARRMAGYPAGYRHELLSLAMVSQQSEVLRRAHDADLVLHLVASHHGWCRPFAPLVDDEEDLAVRLQHGDSAFSASTRHRLSRLDSGVAERFWSLNAKYGRWGLAWLEAVLRLADHRRSELEAEART